MMGRGLGPEEGESQYALWDHRLTGRVWPAEYR